MKRILLSLSLMVILSAHCVKGKSISNGHVGEDNRNKGLSQGQVYALEIEAFEVCDTDADSGLDWNEVDQCIVSTYLKVNENRI